MALKRKQRMLISGICFILPNVIGFLAFMLVPLIASFIMAFTNWDVRLHNMFTNELPRFIGFENFKRLFTEPDFFQYLGNTLFLMMGIPFSITGSLCAALLLNTDIHGKNRKVWGYVIATFLFAGSLLMLLMAGLNATPMLILFGGILSMILITGSVAGKTSYRTLFYFPHFTAGVATFLLWKKMYDPYKGPFTNALHPVLDSVEKIVRALPDPLFSASPWLAGIAVACIAVFGLCNSCKKWLNGEMGSMPLWLGLIMLCLPSILGVFWSVTKGPFVLAAAVVLIAAVAIIIMFFKGRRWTCNPDEGIGLGMILAGVLMVLQFVLLGLSNVAYHLPAMSADGLAPPEWLTDYHWAKPSIMIMGLWAAIGSNNMLLYLAGLSNVPQELYEAASIDGASGRQRFWSVTWPQLAPVTFFIVVMSVIHGLRGGFEMARTMTRGGPAGATTTLSYYLYMEGFEIGRLGYASAIAWTLFGLIFAITIFNWKFGNRYTNN